MFGCLCGPLNMVYEIKGYLEIATERPVYIWQRLRQCAIAQFYIFVQSTFQRSTT